MKAFSITMLWIVCWAGLASCSAEYLSPRTGIKYRFEVPLEKVLDRYAPIQVSPTK